MIKTFLNQRCGATSIEYALIGGLIFLVIITALTTIGTGLSTIFADVSAPFAAP